MNAPVPAAAFVVTVVAYRPPAELLARLTQLLDAGFPLAIFDNGPADDPHGLSLLRERCVWYGGKAQNQGLGRAMQALLQAAKAAGYPWALYFDQDTRFSEKTLHWIGQKLSLQHQVLQQVAAVQCTGEGEAGRAVPKSLLINSGCLFQLALQTDWGHDPSFFVEGVDYKFCLDAAHHGYQLLQWEGCPDYDHHSLQPIVYFAWRGKKIAHRSYPWRRQLQFLGNLLRLALIALTRGQFGYAARFSRNFATHLLKQTQGKLLAAIERLGLVKKCVSLLLMFFYHQFSHGPYSLFF
jgi:hypothetical protein